MVDLPVHRFAGRDGVDLAFREVGSGRPLVWLHGFGSSAAAWIGYGPAGRLAERGFRVIVPDLRGHGDSARPHDASCYPPDVLADDGLTLVEHLGLTDYDLAGYSLGGRVVLRMQVRGARPRRAIVGGQGLDIITRSTTRTGRYHGIMTALVAGDQINPDSPDAELAHWITKSGNDPQALLRVLGTHVPTPESDLAGLLTPTLVFIGDQDPDHISAEALAATLPQARFTTVPGNHFTALTTPQLAHTVIEFLT